jgi:hypothetical protein
MGTLIMLTLKYSVRGRLDVSGTLPPGSKVSVKFYSYNGATRQDIGVETKSCCRRQDDLSNMRFHFDPSRAINHIVVINVSIIPACKVRLKLDDCMDPISNRKVKLHLLDAGVSLPPPFIPTSIKSPCVSMVRKIPDDELILLEEAYPLEAPDLSHFLPSSTDLPYSSNESSPPLLEPKEHSLPLKKRKITFMGVPLVTVEAISEPLSPDLGAAYDTLPKNEEEPAEEKKELEKEEQKKELDKEEEKKELEKKEQKKELEKEEEEEQEKEEEEEQEKEEEKKELEKEGLQCSLENKLSRYKRKLVEGVVMYTNIITLRIRARNNLISQWTP